MQKEYLKDYMMMMTKKMKNMNKKIYFNEKLTNRWDTNKFVDGWMGI